MHSRSVVDTTRSRYRHTDSRASREVGGGREQDMSERERDRYQTENTKRYQRSEGKEGEGREENMLALHTWLERGK